MSRQVSRTSAAATDDGTAPFCQPRLPVLVQVTPSTCTTRTFLPPVDSVAAKAGPSMSSSVRDLTARLPLTFVVVDWDTW